MNESLLIIYVNLVKKMSSDLIHPIRNTQQLLSTLALVIPELQQMLVRIEETGQELSDLEDRSTFIHNFCLRYSEILSDYTVTVLNKLRRNPRTGESMPMKSDEVSYLKVLMYRIMEYGLQMMPYIQSLFSMLMSGFAYSSSDYSFYQPSLQISSLAPEPTTVLIEEIE